MSVRYGNFVQRECEFEILFLLHVFLSSFELVGKQENCIKRLLSTPLLHKIKCKYSLLHIYFFKVSFHIFVKKVDTFIQVQNLIFLSERL